MACWDILGKVSGLPVCELMGGRHSYFEPSTGAELHGYPLYRAISQRSALEMAENVGKYVDQGYHKIQLKVGGNDVQEDIRRILAVRTMLDDKAEALQSRPRNLPAKHLLTSATRDEACWKAMCCQPRSPRTAA